MVIDSNKFIELLRPNYNDSVRYCRALCSGGSADDAEDVLQQALLQALEKFDSLNDESKFRSWLFTIITRVFYTSIRKNFWRKFLRLDINEHIKEIPDIYNRMEIFETKAILNDALSKLSTKERAAILLFEIADFSIEEIKAMQDENSISAIKSRLSRARKKLKNFILESENHNSKLKQTQSTLIEDIEDETIKLTAQYKSGK